MDNFMDAHIDYEITVENDGDLEAGQLKNLNDLVAGAKVTFIGCDDGVVIGDMGPYTTGGDTDDIVSRRLHIKHGIAGESFHTYRHDGRSNHDASHDITSVTVKTPREKLCKKFLDMHEETRCNPFHFFERLVKEGIIKIEE